MRRLRSPKLHDDLRLFGIVLMAGSLPLQVEPQRSLLFYGGISAYLIALYLEYLNLDTP